MSAAVTTAIEDRRVALGMSRNEAAQLCGVTAGEAWSIEKGKTPRGGAAVVRKYEDWLDEMEHRRDSGWTAPMYPAPPGGSVLPEYRGLKLGSRFMVRTETGLWTFLGLVREKNGTEYVAAYGGRPGHAAHRAFSIWKCAFPADPLASDRFSDEGVAVDDTEDRDA